MGLFDMFTSFLNPGKGYQKGQEQLDKYYGQSQQYLQPYQQQGQEAYGALNEAQNNLLNPSGLHDRWLQEYNQSEASKIAQARAMEQGNRAAASTGVLGSTPHLQALQAGSAEIGAQDQEHYIDRMIQQYLQGAGIAQNIYGHGANAGNQMSQNATNMGNESANMAYGRQNAPGQLFGQLLGTGANLAGGYMGYQGMNNLANAWKTKGGQ
jgi:hypothetical protein